MSEQATQMETKEYRVVLATQPETVYGDTDTVLHRADSVMEATDWINENFKARIVGAGETQLQLRDSRGSIVSSYFIV